MSAQRSRVLVIEDEPSARELIVRQLQLLGWEVLPVETGEAAVGAIQDGQRVNLILADIQLPGMSGLTAVRAIVSLAPDARVVFMSGAVDIDPAVGSAPFLRKPFSVSELATALEDAMRHM